MRFKYIGTTLCGILVFRGPMRLFNPSLGEEHKEFSRAGRHVEEEKEEEEEEEEEEENIEEKNLRACEWRDVYVEPKMYERWKSSVYVLQSSPIYYERGAVSHRTPSSISHRKLVAF
ncbi:hypothetical protein M0802_005567 [Mischocyttarus mexicanus]|nr:hypothetical protein M0802_005567 [Mischocyttarus mexicanus]